MFTQCVVIIKNTLKVKVIFILLHTYFRLELFGCHHIEILHRDTPGNGRQLSLTLKLKLKSSPNLFKMYGKKSQGNGKKSQGNGQKKTEKNLTAKRLKEVAKSTAQTEVQLKDGAWEGSAVGAGEASEDGAREGSEVGAGEGSEDGAREGSEVGAGEGSCCVGDGVMGGSGPTDMDIDNVDMHILPYVDLDAFAFGNLASLPAFDAKTEERRSGAMRSFIVDV
jgi:hypothetical protein